MHQLSCFFLILAFIAIVGTLGISAAAVDIPFPHLKRPLILSHRGSRCLRPENTLETMHAALQIGGHVLEFDVRLTSDHHLVVYHDDEVERTTNAVGLVRSFTLQKLQALDAAYRYSVDGEAEQVFHYRGKGIQIPTLRQFLREFWGEPEPHGDNHAQAGSIHLVSMNIEIKDEDFMAVDKLIEELSRYGLNRIRNYVSVISRFCSVLNDFRSKTEQYNIPTAACEGEATKFVIKSKIRSSINSLTLKNKWIDRTLFTEKSSKNLKYSSLQIPYNSGGVPLDTKEIVDYAHEQHSEVHYWVVNTRVLMDHLLSIGADAIITDRTDLAVQLFKDRNVYHAPQHSYSNTRELIEYHVPLIDHIETHSCVTASCVLIQNSQLVIVLALLIGLIVSYQCLYCCCSCMYAGNKLRKTKVE